MNAKTSLLERIKTLGEKARAIHENPDSFKDGFAKWEADQKALETELTAIDKEAGKGLVVVVVLLSVLPMAMLLTLSPKSARTTWLWSGCLVRWLLVPSCGIEPQQNRVDCQSSHC